MGVKEKMGGRNGVGSGSRQKSLIRCLTEKAVSGYCGKAIYTDDKREAASERSDYSALEMLLPQTQKGLYWRLEGAWTLPFSPSSPKY